MYQCHWKIYYLVIGHKHTISYEYTVKLNMKDQADDRAPMSEDHFPWNLFLDIHVNSSLAKDHPSFKTIFTYFQVGLKRGVPLYHYLAQMYHFH